MWASQVASQLLCQMLSPQRLIEFRIVQLVSGIVEHERAMLGKGQRPECQKVKLTWELSPIPSVRLA